MILSTKVDFGKNFRLAVISDRILYYTRVLHKRTLKRLVCETQMHLPNTRMKGIPITRTKWGQVGHVMSDEERVNDKFPSTHPTWSITSFEENTVHIK